MAMSTLHSYGAAAGPNVLGWGVGTKLGLFFGGIVSALTGSRRIGWLSACVAVSGLYPAVWHVTGAPHSLGDLATVVGSCLVLLPKRYSRLAQGNRWVALVSIVGAAAATTKISLLPLAAVITCIGVWRSSDASDWRMKSLVAAGAWTAIYGPLLIWSTIRTGSPLGLATASLFH